MSRKVDLNKYKTAMTVLAYECSNPTEMSLTEWTKQWKLGNRAAHVLVDELGWVDRQKIGKKTLIKWTGPDEISQEDAQMVFDRIKEYNRKFAETTEKASEAVPLDVERKMDGLQVRMDGLEKQMVFFSETIKELVEVLRGTQATLDGLTKVMERQQEVRANAQH